MHKSKLFIFLFFATYISYAQEKVYSSDTIRLAAFADNKPGISEDAFLVESKFVQIDHSFNFQHDYNSTLDEQVSNYGTSLRYGFSTVFEGNFLLGYVRNKATLQENKSVEIYRGFNVVSIGGKILAIKQTGIIPTVSIESNLQLPYFGKSEFRPKYVTPNLTLLASHVVGAKFSLNYNLGIGWTDGLKAPSYSYNYNMGYAITNAFGVFIDSYGSIAQLGSLSNGFDFGMEYFFDNNFKFEVVGGKGITSNTADEFISSKLIYLIRR